MNNNDDIRQADKSYKSCLQKWDSDDDNSTENIMYSINEKKNKKNKKITRKINQEHVSLNHAISQSKKEYNYDDAYNFTQEKNFDQLLNESIAQSEKEFFENQLKQFEKQELVSQPKKEENNFDQMLNESIAQSENDFFENQLKQIQELALEYENIERKRRTDLFESNKLLIRIKNLGSQYQYLYDILQDYINCKIHNADIEPAEYEKFMKFLDEFYVIPLSKNKKTPIDNNTYNVLISIISLSAK